MEWFGMWSFLMLSAWGIPLIIYLAFALPALYFLKKRELEEVPRALWSLVIVAVPVMGAVAFAAVQPGVPRD